MATSAVQLSPTFIFSAAKIRQKMLENLAGVLKAGVVPGEVALQVLDWSEAPASDKVESSVDLAIRPDHIPLVFCTAPPRWIQFNYGQYAELLKTKEMGRTLMYSEKTTSTQIILTKNVSFLSRIPREAGLVFVAMQQTEGKGRRDNQWTSPLGCLLYSVHLDVARGSQLAQRVVFLQYICSLAVVKGILEMPGYEGLDLRLKWPNDIYYGDSTKIGGVLVDCSSGSWGTSAIVGCGINVTNSQPTKCLNDIIAECNEKNSTDLAPLFLSQVLAVSLNKFELLLSQFERLGTEPFLDNYYDKWLHSHTKVKLGGEHDGEEVMIVGIDDSGYLQVRRENNETVTVQPDGNSFDMMAGLLIVRVPAAKS